MLSNSKTQKIYIDSKAKEKGFGNIEVRRRVLNLSFSFCPCSFDPYFSQVITGDVNVFEFPPEKKSVPFRTILFLTSARRVLPPQR